MVVGCCWGVVVESLFCTAHAPSANGNNIHLSGWWPCDTAAWWWVSSQALVPLAWIGRGAALHVWSPAAGHNSPWDMGIWALSLSSERVLIKELIKAPSRPLTQGSAVREGVDVNIWGSRQRGCQTGSGMFLRVHRT